MKTIRIFISSPGDVAEERDRAKQVVEQLRARYAGQFNLKAVLWEDLPLQADLSFQQGIDTILSREQGVDIAILILWSRLGSPLGALVRKSDGTEYRSGTEREFDLIMAARRENKLRDPKSDSPKVLVYTRWDEASFEERLRGKATDEKNRLVSQKKLVENFIHEEFHDAASGANVGAYHSFDQPIVFSQRLRAHLQEILDGLAGGIAGEPVWDIAQKGSPFRGLEAFEFEHAPVFFGREDEVLEVRRALQRKAREGCAFVLVSGASGSGKSSLARAGVIPAVVEHEVDSSVVGWRHLVCTPSELGRDLCGGLARALCSDAVLPELRAGADTAAVLTEGLTRDPRLTVDQSLRPALARARQGKPPAGRLLLLVDQLEELFTDKRLTDAERRQFMAALEALGRSGVVWVLATVRSDFYHHCQQLPALIRMKGGLGQIDLLPPGADAFRRLIEHPARLAGLRFEARDGTSLADRILADATVHAALLPLVSYVLRELFERRTPEGVLTFDIYKQLGGAQGAVAVRAEQVFARLSAAAKEAFPAVARALVRVSENSQALRQRAPMAQFESAAGACELVKAFVAERLFVTDHDDEGNATVSVAHEAILSVWERLAFWIRENRELLMGRARIEQGAAIWETKARDASYLLRPGKPLEEAEDILHKFGTTLSAAARAYVQASILAVQEAAAENAREKLRQALRLWQRADDLWADFRNTGNRHNDEWRFTRLSEIEGLLAESLSLNPDSADTAGRLAGIRRLLVETGIKTKDLNLASIYLQKLKSGSLCKDMPVPDLTAELEAAWAESDPVRNPLVRSMRQWALHGCWVSLLWTALLTVIVVVFKPGISAEQVPVWVWAAAAVAMLLQYAVALCALLAASGEQRMLDWAYAGSRMLCLAAIPAANPISLAVAARVAHCISKIRMLKLLWPKPATRSDAGEIHYDRPPHC